MTPRATLVNQSGKSRRSTAICTWPLSAVDGFGTECTFTTDDGRRFRAVRCSNRGISHAVFRVSA